MRPCWNVYVENVNKREIEVYNVFDHSGFFNDCQDTLRESKKKNLSSKQVAERIRLHLFYYFGHKCEWEIILSDWPPSKQFNSEKVSVYDQVMLNFNSFMRCVYENDLLETNDLEVAK